MMRLLAYLIASLLTLLLVLSGTLIFLVNSDWGTQQLIRQVLPYLSGQWQIGKIQGHLSHQIILTDIHYTADHRQLSLAKLQLTWQPQQLFQHKLWINQLILTQLKIIAWSTSSTAHQTDFKLPFLQQIIVQQLSIQPLLLPKTPLSKGQSFSPAINAIHMTINGNLNWHIVLHYLKSQWDIKAGNNHIVLQMQFNQHWLAQWQIQIPQLSDLLPRSQGQLSSNGNLIYLPNQLPQIQATLTAKALKLPQFSLANLTFTGELLGDQPGKFKLHLQQARYQQQRLNQLTLTGTGTLTQHQLQWQVSLPTLSSVGKLQGHWQNATWRGQLLNTSVTSKTTGRWYLTAPATLILRRQFIQLTQVNWQGTQGKVALEGQWQSGKYTFNVQGKFPIPSLGIVANPLTLNIKGNENQCHYQGIFNSHQGHLQVNGQANFKPLTNHLQIQGQNFLAINIPHYQVWLSPNLQLIYANTQWQLTGDLSIPQALISQPDFDQQTVTLPSEVIFIGPPPPHQAKPSLFNNMNAAINLTVGPNVQLKMAGLAADFRGALQIEQTKTHPATANGQLTINQGTYLAYGKELSLRHGKLLFNHSLIENPTLQLKASKKITVLNTANFSAVNNSTSLLPGLSGAPIVTSQLTPNFNYSQKVEVGVDVTGTLQNPQLSLYANPPFITSQADMLSYLVFGHAADQLSFADARILLQTSSKLKLPSTDIEQITQDLQNALGLDQFKIGSATYVDPKTGSLAQDTALILGKALSPSFYISYSRGLSSSLNILTLSYLLSQHWSLQSSSGTLGTGADIIYTLTRD